jgi:hypothetical protein
LQVPQPISNECICNSSTTYILGDGSIDYDYLNYGEFNSCKSCLQFIQPP